MSYPHAAPLWILLLLIGCRSTPSFPDDPPSTSVIQSYWEGHLARALHGTAVGYAYAIYRHGKPVATGGVGLARLPLSSSEPGVPMTTDIRMQIASVSKPLTALALLRELDRHGIPPDTTMWSLIGERFTDPGDGVKAVTITQLLTHRSGYPFGYIHSPRWENTRDLLRKPLPGTPGERQYSNINTSLLRTILEVISGRDYEEYVREELLSRVSAGGMKLHAEAKEVSHSYRAGEEPLRGVPIADDFGDEGAAYGWYGTVDELMQVLLAIRNHVFLTPEATRQMFAKGLGWGTVRTVAGSAYRHDGQWVTEGNRGVRTGIAVFPDGVDAVFFSNTNGPFFPGDILVRGFDGCMPRVSFSTDPERRIASVHVERPPHAEEVRWTVDGSDPVISSPLYQRCVDVAVPATFRCQGFTDGQSATFVNSVDLEG